MRILLLEKFESIQPFTDAEAWLLFRLAAFAEAFGWTLLISGIFCKRYIVHGNNIPVLIAGQIHGTLFLIYLVAAVILYSSLHWTRMRALVAILASVPPYGSLVFELWSARSRKRAELKIHCNVLAYQAISE